MGDANQTRMITNPLDEVFRFKFDNMPYEIPARKTVPLVGFLAEHAAKHLAYKILIGKGRLTDTIKRDGKRSPHAIPRGEAEAIKMALLDCDGEKLDLEKILADARGAMAPSKDLPLAPAEAGVGDKKAQEIEGQPAKEEKSEEAPEEAPEEKGEEKGEEKEEPEGEAIPGEAIPGEVTPEKEFAALKAVGYKNLNNKTRDRYSELKKQLDK